jgi:hypothetical protein
MVTVSPVAAKAIVGTRYRVLDLNARRTIAHGLTLGQAHDLIKQGKAANQQARFDIRTETRS